MHKIERVSMSTKGLETFLDNYDSRYEIVSSNLKYHFDGYDEYITGLIVFKLKDGNKSGS